MAEYLLRRRVCEVNFAYIVSGERKKRRTAAETICGWPGILEAIPIRLPSFIHVRLPRWQSLDGRRLGFDEARSKYENSYNRFAWFCR